MGFDRYFGFNTTQKKTLADLLAAAGGDVADGSVTNASVATGANIALAKLANVAAGTDGLSAGTMQATLQALASRVQALEDAA